MRMVHIHRLLLPAAFCLAASALPAHALSEVQTPDGQTVTVLPDDGSVETDFDPSSQPAPELTPSSSVESGTELSPDGEPGPVETAPLPPPEPAGENDPTQSSDGPESEDEIAGPAAEDRPPPAINYDMDALPEPVARMRQLILDAARTGDIEKLRPLLGTGERQTALSLSVLEGDPIAFLKDISGDPEGQEILAILSEILEAGYVHLDAGKPTELYVWPYFFARSLEGLTPEQKVELFRIVTAGDYADMKQVGAYIFYRVGITPAGEWTFFVAGD